VHNLVELEDYIAGVVPSELVLWSAEEEEIAAQAIAARTYALRSMVERSRGTPSAFLWDDTRDQVYIGVFQSGNSSAARRVHERYLRGLDRGRSRVVVDEHGQLYDVRFHASCGGVTCSPAEAFPRESVLHHAPVPCEPCRSLGEEERTWAVSDARRRQVHWTWTADASSLAQLAAKTGIGGRTIALGSPHKDQNERWQSLELQGDSSRARISIEMLRRELDPALLKSGLILRTWPAAGTEITSGVFFEGLGRGHGAGLCQIGSHAFASRGWSARQILAHYLPGARLASIADNATADPL
jgi:stage II sporulation protein D